MPSTHVRFCRDRAGKVPICRELRITHFIDDRADVLGHLEGTVPRLYRFAAGGDEAEDGAARWMSLRGWMDARELVRPAPP